MNDAPSLRSSKGLLLGLFAVTALALAAGGYRFYRWEVESIRAEKYSELKAVAELKVEQIVAWRNERLTDARLNSSGIVRTHALEWLKAPQDDSLKTDIRARLKVFRDAEGYRDMILTAPDGRFLLSTDTHLRNWRPQRGNWRRSRLPRVGLPSATSSAVRSVIKSTSTWRRRSWTRNSARLPRSPAYQSGGLSLPSRPILAHTEQELGDPAPTQGWRRRPVSECAPSSARPGPDLAHPTVAH